jgi:mannosyl-3-phosphoglycerate phosphatase
MPSPFLQQAVSSSIAAAGAPLVVLLAHVEQRLLDARAGPGAIDAQVRLAAEGIALVLYGSMTRAELDMIQQQLGIRQPFICESGAAIHVPDAYFPFDIPGGRRLPGGTALEFGRPYSEVAGILRRCAARLDIPILGFQDQSVEQVAGECGLSLSSARLAKLREYEEPFRLLGPSPEGRHQLWRSLRAAGLCCTATAGPYEHAGAPVNKGATIEALVRLYRRACPEVVTAALATGSDGSVLLRAVEIPLSLPGPAASGPREGAEPPTQADWLATRIDRAARARRESRASG